MHLAYMPGFFLLMWQSLFGFFPSGWTIGSIPGLGHYEHSEYSCYKHLYTNRFLISFELHPWAVFQEVGFLGQSMYMIIFMAHIFVARFLFRTIVLGCRAAMCLVSPFPQYPTAMSVVIFINLLYFNWCKIPFGCLNLNSVNYEKNWTFPKSFCCPLSPIPGLVNSTMQFCLKHRRRGHFLLILLLGSHALPVTY